jgi:hypothetical protein
MHLHDVLARALKDLSVSGTAALAGLVEGSR